MIIVRDAIVFEKIPSHETQSHSSGLESVFGKLRFRDGLVWTVGLKVEIKLCFEICPA